MPWRLLMLPLWLGGQGTAWPGPTTWPVYFAHEWDCVKDRWIGTPDFCGAEGQQEG